MNRAHIHIYICDGQSYVSIWLGNGAQILGILDTILDVSMRVFLYEIYM